MKLYHAFFIIGTHSETNVLQISLLSCANAFFYEQIMWCVNSTTPYL